MRLRPIKYKELIAKLKRHGLSGPFPGGRHPYFLLSDKRRVLVPNDHDYDINIRILKRIIFQLGIKEEEFLDL